MKRIILIVMVISNMIILMPVCFAQACPELVSEIPVSETSYNIELYESYAFILEGSHVENTIRVWDLSIPSQPVQTNVVLDDLLDLTSTIDFAIHGNILYELFAYTPALRGQWDAGIVTFDISNPLQPVRLGVYREYGIESTFPYESIYVYSSLAYLIGHTGYMKVVDVSDPANPFERNNITTPDESFSHISRISHYLYLPDGSGFYIADLTNPSAPTIDEDLFAFSASKEIVFRFPYAYLASSGLTILDVSNPATPLLVFDYDEPSLRQITVNDNVLYGYDTALYVYDLVDPINPVLRGVHTDSQRTPYDMAIGTSYAYLIGTHASGPVISVFDISACQSKGISYIPAAANKIGSHDTNWKTDLVLHNRGEEEISIALTFLQTGHDNSNAQPLTITIQPDTSVLLPNVVGGFFNRTNVSGAIRVDGCDAIVLSSRTYNDLEEEGTYGQSISARKLEDGITDFSEGRLVQLIQTEDFRSNIGFVNATGGSVELYVTLYSEEGIELGSIPYTLFPYEHFQEDAIYTLVTADPVPNGYAVITTETQGARIFAYASVVDNRTGDAVYIPHQ